MYKDNFRKENLEIYLGLVAEAHDHLTQEAACVAVACEQLGHSGVEGPVALESKKFVKLCNYFDSGSLFSETCWPRSCSPAPPARSRRSP